MAVVLRNSELIPATNENIRLIQKIKNAIRDFLDKVRAYLNRAERMKMTREEVQNFKALEGSLAELEELFSKAIRSMERAKEQGIERGAVATEVDESRGRESSVEEPSIKEQVRKHLDELKKMEPVDNVELVNVPEKGNFQARNRMYDLFKEKYGITKRETLFVESRVLGEVNILIKDISSALRYIKNDMEFSTILAIPEVIKNGMRIDDDSHRNHKGRGHPTYTVAAPVLIGDKLGFVGVVVKQTGTLKYKIHRVLTPDGRAIEINETSGHNDKMTANVSGESLSKTTDFNENYTTSKSKSQEKRSKESRSSNGTNDVASSTTFDHIDAYKLLEKERIRAEYFKGQLKLTRKHTPDSKSVRNAFASYIGEYNGDLTSEELVRELGKLYTLQNKYADNSTAHNFAEL